MGGDGHSKPLDPNPPQSHGIRPTSLPTPPVSQHPIRPREPSNTISSGYQPVDTVVTFIPRQGEPGWRPKGAPSALRPGPAPALGRPADLPTDHGSWRDQSCIARNTKGWKPEITTLAAAHSCPGIKGPLGMTRPPNTSGSSPNGYNENIFRDEKDVANALMYCGYRSSYGNSMLRAFQADWNRVSASLSVNRERYKNIPLVHVPTGNLKTDGMIGPQSLRALEVALVNQRSGQVSWCGLIDLISRGASGFGRGKVYNAIHPTYS